jgi:hypothetical protein
MRIFVFFLVQLNIVLLAIKLIQLIINALHASIVISLRMIANVLHVMIVIAKPVPLLVQDNALGALITNI